MMAYRARYEDSYLDDEDDENDGDDAARLLSYIGNEERAWKKKEDILIERLFARTRIPAESTKAVVALKAAALAYQTYGHGADALKIWVRLAEFAEAVGNQELYYEAVDRMAQ